MFLRDSIRLRVSRQAVASYRVDVTVSDGSTIRGSFKLNRRALAKAGLARVGQEPITPDSLASAVFGEIGKEFKAALSVGYPSPRILLTIDPAELWPLPWEGLTAKWPLNTGLFRGNRTILRYSGYPDRLALVPMTMPLSAALVEPTRRANETRARLKKYYSTLERSSTAALAGLLSAGQFDIVHLECRARIDASGQMRLAVGSDEGISLPVLRRALRASEARLLVLEGEPGSRPALLQAGHTILGRSGPAVIVTDSGVGFGSFYYELLHDPALDELVSRSLPKGTVLLIARYGDQTLSLDRAARSMAADMELGSTAVTTAFETLKGLAPRSAGPVSSAPAVRSAPGGTRTGVGDHSRLAFPRMAIRPSPVATLGVAQQTLGALSRRMYDFHQESHGVVPMTATTAEYGTVVDEVGGLVPGLQRVVNTWFESKQQLVPSTQSLVAGQRYTLNLNVALPDSRNIVQAPVGISETFLADKYEDHGVKLRVILSGGDFKVDRPEQELLVPRPPGSSNTLSFQVSAPKVAARARLRVGLYYRNNLLQSILITAAVAHQSDADSVGVGVGAEVEWALTGDLGALDRYEARAINLLANDAPDGGHVFVIVGDDIKRQIDFGSGELEKRVGAVRTKLQAVCNTFKSDGHTPDRYRFGADNRGQEGQLLGDLKGLANVGFGLWTEIEAGDEAWSAKLQDRIKAPTVIQVAGVKSASYVFPWSAVYDHPFVPQAKNRLCPEVASALKGGIDGTGLAKVVCFADGCPNRDDINVVCPSGFWGMRHEIEQPLSAARIDVEDRATQDLAGQEDVAFSIDARNGLHATIGLSENLLDWQQHSKDAGALFGGIPGVSSLDDLGNALRSTDLQVIYFYCHGGRAAGEAWLGVGTKRQPEKIYPQSFRAWKLKWPTIRPLVFINGCKTVGITPDDLLSFNRTLAWCRAAGVVGAEITIPETLAKWFGLEFLKAFKTGRQMGGLIRDLRLDLLARYNPLGLAYTPYCMSTLHLEV